MINKNMIARLLMIQRTKSISKAAEQLYVSRSSLVQQVKQIEEEVGFPVFERYSHGVEITPAGENLLNGMQTIVRNYDDLIKTGREMYERETRQIVIGSLPHFQSICIQQICEKYSRKFPDSSFVFKDYPLEEYFQRFLKGEFDICVEYMMDYNNDGMDISYKKTGETEYICGFPAGHRFYNAEEISLEELEGERLIAYSAGISHSADRFHRYVKREYPQIHLIDVDSYDSNLYARCALENAGIIMFKGYETCFPLFHYVDLNPRFTVNLGIGYHSDCSELIDNFVNNI